MSSNGGVFRRYILRSRNALQLVGVAIVAGAVVITLPFLEGDPDGAKIETIDSNRPEPVAMEQVGAEDIEAPSLLRIEGGEELSAGEVAANEEIDLSTTTTDPTSTTASTTTTADPTTTSDPSTTADPSVSSSTSAAESVAGNQVLEVSLDGPASTTTSATSTTSTTSPRDRFTTTTRGTDAQLTTLRPTTSLVGTSPTTRRTTTTRHTTSTTTGITATTRSTTTRPTTSRPTTSRPTTSRPTTSRPTTSRPTTSQPTTTRPTTSRPTTSRPTTSRPTTSRPTTSAPTTAPPTTERTGPVAAAQIPFANNGVGDGANGGRSPYTPPRAALGFTDIADRSATTVQASCASASVDCGAQIKNIMRTNRTRPLKITFGDASQRGATVTFRTPIQLESDVYLEGINQPRVVVTASTILFNVSGTDNVSIRNFDLDLQRCSIGSSPVVAATSPVDNLYISGIKVVNAQKNATDPCTADFLRLSQNGSGTNIHVYDNDVSWVRRFIRVMADVDDIRVYNNTIRNIGFEGYVQTESSISRDVYIEGNIFSRHSPKARGGHMIGFPISKAASPKTYARNVIVRNNLVEGNPNVAHIRDGIIAQPNGAAGDLIALRGIDGFLLESNMVRHSGEVGITATAGLKNGVIRYNQVSYTDTTGIVLGNSARNSNERVRNVDVYRNEMFQNSLDRSGEFRGKNQQHPAFSLWNTSDSCMVNNYIHHNANNGFWVYDGTNPGWAGTEVWDVYIHLNDYNNNRNDFVADKNHVPPFPAASPYGGDRWTTTFDRAIDNDGDGLPGLCASERNDNDPCSPDVFAEACRR